MGGDLSSLAIPESVIETVFYANGDRKAVALMAFPF